MKKTNDQQAGWGERLKGYVLVVEDVAADRKSIAAMLHSFSMYYQVLNNNQQAVKALTGVAAAPVDNPCDVLLIKHPTQEMSGFEAANIINTSRKQQALPALPIIVLIEHGYTQNDQNSSIIEANTCLYKPFTKEDLYEAIQDQFSVLGHDANGFDVTKVSIDVALLDQGALDEIRVLQNEGSPDILLKIIRLYFANSPKLVQAIAAAVPAKDAEQLKVAAHTLKSSSAILGATNLSAMCSRLEDVGRTEELNDETTCLLDQLQHEYAAVKKALAAEYHKQPL